MSPGLLGALPARELSPGDSHVLGEGVATPAHASPEHSCPSLHVGLHTPGGRPGPDHSSAGLAVEPTRPVLRASACPRSRHCVGAVRAARPALKGLPYPPRPAS